MYHTSGPPLFIGTYLPMQRENEAQNKRMQKPAKLYTLFFKNTNGGTRKLFKKRVNADGNNGKGRRRAPSDSEHSGLAL